MVLSSRLMSFSVRRISSIGLSPVSLLSISFVFSGFVVCVIIVSIWLVDGIFLIFASFWYFGFFHSIL